MQQKIIMILTQEVKAEKMFDFQMRQKQFEESLSYKKSRVKRFFHTNERWIGPSLLLC